MCDRNDLSIGFQKERIRPLLMGSFKTIEWVRSVKYIQIVILSLILGSTVGLVGCKERKKTLSKATILKRLKWAKPGCRMFYKKMIGLCGEFLKKKKRTIDKKKFLIQCAKKSVVTPRAFKQRFFCASVVRTCGHLRHCNKCGKPFCKTWKKGPKVPKFKFVKKKLRKKPATRRGVQAPAKNAVPKKASSAKKVAPKQPTKSKAKAPVQRPKTPQRRPAPRVR